MQLVNGQYLETLYLEKMEDLTRAYILDAKVYRNDKFDYKFVVTRLDTGAAYSLAGKTLKVEIKKKGLAGAVSAKTVTNGAELAIGGAGNNELTFNFIFDIAADTYAWDCEIVEDKYTIFRGELQVIQDVTNG